jgi:hypothetical protein
MNLKNYHLKPLISLFYLYTALNYNGYDKENNKEGMHPFRKKIRNYLQDQSLPKFDFCFHPYQYAKQILTTKNLNPSSKTNIDFIPAIKYLQEFTEKANLKNLEENFIQSTDKAMEKYQDILPNVLKIVGDFFQFQPEINKLIFTVNLLESYYRGFSIQLEKTGYLITGPSDSPNIRNLLHELIHFYINTIDSPKIHQSASQKIPKEIINNYGNSLLSESLIRALVVYLSQKDNTLPKQELNPNDISMIYPQKFLELLDKKSVNDLTKNQIKNLYIEVID